jgi:hypothetical protein
MKEALLLEYEKLKDEQRARITIRENLFFSTLIAIGAVFSALQTMSQLQIGYLALTPVLFIISNAYYYNDEIISRMNLYIQTSLAPRLAAAAGWRTEDLFQWEGFTRRNRRVRRRVYQLVANLALYPGASAASLAFFGSRRAHPSPVEQLAIVTCFLITALMLLQVLHYADLFSVRRDADAGQPSDEAGPEPASPPDINKPAE